MVLCMILRNPERISIPIWIPFPPSGTVPLGPLYTYFSCSRIRDRQQSWISIIFSYVSSYLCKLLGLTSSGEYHWRLSEGARGTDDSRVILPSRHSSQRPLQLYAHHWYRHHHKWSSCEPDSAHAGAFTGELSQQHLSGQCMAYRLASSWRTCSVHFPGLSSIFWCLATIPWSPHPWLSSRNWKSDPIALGYISLHFALVAAFLVY